MIHKAWSFTIYSQDPSVKNIKFRNKSRTKIFPIEDNAFYKWKQNVVFKTVPISAIIIWLLNGDQLFA